MIGVARHSGRDPPHRRRRAGRDDCCDPSWPAVRDLLRVPYTPHFDERPHLRRPCFAGQSFCGGAANSSGDAMGAGRSLQRFGGNPTRSPKVGSQRGRGLPGVHHLCRPPSEPERLNSPPMAQNLTVAMAAFLDDSGSYLAPALRKDSLRQELRTPAAQPVRRVASSEVLGFRLQAQSPTEDATSIAGFTGGALPNASA